MLRWSWNQQGSINSGRQKWLARKRKICFRKRDSSETSRHSNCSIHSCSIYSFSLPYVVEQNTEDSDTSCQKLGSLNHQNRWANLVCTEDVSKKIRGGISLTKKEPKQVIQSTNVANAEWYLVRMYNLYNAKCTLGHPDGALYLKLLIVPRDVCWY